MIQVPLVIYFASVAGAVSLYLAMPKQRLHWPVPAGIIGAGALGGLWFCLKQMSATPDSMLLHYIFSAIAIFSSVMMITHTRPVYSALWFVMVVLASAGLLILMLASFIAIAMIIIYAGAIVVTYIFVIMLAAPTHATSTTPATHRTAYDRLAWRPLAAVCAGFLLIATLLNIAFEYREPDQLAISHDTDRIHNLLLDHAATSTIENLEYPENRPEPTNIEMIGLELFIAHPLGLELAAILLLVALIGAIILARMIPTTRPGTVNTILNGRME